MSTFLITGSNRGIGLELCSQIHQRGDKVIAACRKASPELNKLGVRIEENIDISSDKSVTTLSEKLTGINIDCLIHNAGIYEFNSFEDLDKKSIIRQFEVNALSPIFMTQALKHLLKRFSKVAFITSRMGSIGDNTSGSSYGYRMSKVALSMAAKSLSVDLLKEEIYVAILHPGLVSTRMTGFTRSGITTKESVNGILKRIHFLNKDNSGTFWHANGEILPW